MCATVEARGQLQESFSGKLLSPLKLSLNLELINQTRLTGQEAPGIFLLSLSALGLQLHVIKPGILTYVLGI